MKDAILIGLLFSIPVAAQVAPQRHNSGCLQASFGGQVSGGESFTQSLGNGLVLHLTPLKDNWGWQVTVSPEGSDDDWAYPVNPPLRFGNSEYLGTGYGESARQVLSYKHEIRFPLTYVDYRRMSKLAEEALWPDQSKEQPDKIAAAYTDALKRVKTGTLLLRPINYDKDGSPEKVRWMKFNAVVIVPQGFQGNTRLDWKTASCGPS